LVRRASRYSRSVVDSSSATAAAASFAGTTMVRQRARRAAGEACSVQRAACAAPAGARSGGAELWEVTRQNQVAPRFFCVPARTLTTTLTSRQSATQLRLRCWRCSRHAHFARRRRAGCKLGLRARAAAARCVSREAKAHRCVQQQKRRAPCRVTHAARCVRMQRRHALAPSRRRRRGSAHARRTRRTQRAQQQKLLRSWSASRSAAS
jgi:hypothetical protein